LTPAASSRGTGRGSINAAGRTASLRVAPFVLDQ
jgi:hypothetical protein